jgi:hypothetical protein
MGPRSESHKSTIEAGFQKTYLREDFKEAVKEAQDDHRTSAVPSFALMARQVSLDLDNEREVLSHGILRADLRASVFNAQTMTSCRRTKCRIPCLHEGWCAASVFRKNGEHLTRLNMRPGQFGSNLGIDDMDSIAMADRKCDDYGLDTIEMWPPSVFVESEPRLLSSRTREALQLLDEVALARWEGSWVRAVTSRVFGIDRVPAVKGQAPGHSRLMKGLAVTHAIASGADHTAGFVVDDPSRGQVERSKCTDQHMIMMFKSAILHLWWLNLPPHCW